MNSQRSLQATTTADVVPEAPRPHGGRCDETCLCQGRLSAEECDDRADRLWAAIFSANSGGAPAQPAA